MNLSNNYTKSFITALMALLLSACSDFNVQDIATEKVTFDLSQLDADGLYGPVDGKQALSYEFCIPASPDNIAQVLAIDSTAIVYRHSPGREQCTQSQLLVVGNTHQDNHRATLEALAQLEYVTRISQTFFE